MPSGMPSGMTGVMPLGVPFDVPRVVPCVIPSPLKDAQFITVRSVPLGVPSTYTIPSDIQSGSKLNLGSISMLRAAAKIGVKLDQKVKDEGYSIKKEGIKLNYANANGYCVPTNWHHADTYSTESLGHDGAFRPIVNGTLDSDVNAMAFGTESVPRVDKIVGPGNIYVALAKKAVFGYVSIDSIAGPSEILVLADETANPHYVAADLLSQAEHDEMASAILITTSEKLANEVSEEIDKSLEKLSRKEIMQKSLDNYGYILVANDMDDAIMAANEIASEHMEIVTKDSFTVMTKIRNAGAIFLGEYSSEPLGDYFAGPNHVLPTNGTAKFFSPLSVDDFIKKSSIISYSREALEKVHCDIEQFAECEQLTAHANSIKVRFE